MKTIKHAMKILLKMAKIKALNVCYQNYGKLLKKRDVMFQKFKKVLETLFENV